MAAKSRQMSETMRLGIVLTLAGGFQDAYSYNCRGAVFANAQTGNIVLLGQNLAAGQIFAVPHYLFPLIAFGLGIYISEWIRKWFEGVRKIHWRQAVLGIEIIMLIAAGLMPERLDTVANVMMSFACAMQVESFRKFHGIPCATTMCIGNIRSATSMLCQYHITKDKALRKKSMQYYFIIFIFAVGAAIGAGCSKLIGDRAIWIAAALMLLGFVMMFIEDVEDRV